MKIRLRIFWVIKCRERAWKIGCSWKRFVKGTGNPLPLILIQVPSSNQFVSDSRRSMILNSVRRKLDFSWLECERDFCHPHPTFPKIQLQQLPKCTSGSAISPQATTQSNSLQAYKSFQSNTIISQNITKPILSLVYPTPAKKAKKEQMSKG